MYRPACAWSVVISVIPDQDHGFRPKSLHILRKCHSALASRPSGIAACRLPCQGIRGSAKFGVDAARGADTRLLCTCFAAHGGVRCGASAPASLTGCAARPEPGRRRLRGSRLKSALKVAMDGGRPAAACTAQPPDMRRAECQAVAPVTHGRSREGCCGILYACPDRYSALTGSGAVRPQRNAGGWRGTSAQHAGCGAAHWNTGPRRTGPAASR